MPRQSAGLMASSGPYSTSERLTKERKRARQSAESPSSAARKEHEERLKKEAALALLQKSEQRKQHTFKKQLDAKIDQELKLMSHESLKRKQQRLDALQQAEQAREEATRMKLEMIQNASIDVFQKRMKLIQKLTEIEVKDQIYQTSQLLKRQATKEITYDEVRQLAKKKQRQWISDKIEGNKDKLRGNFIYNFERFTKMPLEIERRETAEQVRLYLKDSLDERAKLVAQSHADAPKIYQDVIDNIIKQRQEEVTEYFNHKLHDDHLTKINKLNHAKTVLGLTRDEIEDLLEADVEVYETDIGIADAEMDRIRTLIQQQQNIRQSNQATHDKISAQLQAQIEHDHAALVNTRTMIQNLKDKSAQLTKEKECLFGDLLGLSLSAIESKTIQMNNESESLKKRSKDLHDDLSLRVKLDVQTAQDIHAKHLAETEIEEAKAKQRSDKVQLLDDELNSRSNVLKAFRDRIAELKQLTITKRREREQLKKKLHMEQNKRFAEMIANEDICQINKQLIEATASELDFRQEQNGNFMRRLVSKLNHLKGILSEKELNAATLIENIAFLMAYINDGEGIELPHQVLTKYKDQVDIKWEEWVQALDKHAFEQAKQDISKSIYEQKLCDLKEKFAHNCFMRDERGAIVGCDVEKILICANPLKDYSASELAQIEEDNTREQLKVIEKRIADEWDILAAQIFKEQRMLGLIRYLDTIRQEHHVEPHLLQNLSDSFKLLMDVYNTESSAFSGLQHKNGIFSGGTGGLQYLLVPSHKLPPPNLDILQMPDFYVPRNLQDEKDMSEVVVEIDENPISDQLYNKTDPASHEVDEDIVTEGVTNVIQAEEEGVARPGSVENPILIQPLRDVFELLTIERIERQIRRQKDREDDKLTREQEMEILKDEIRNGNRKIQVHKAEDIRSRFEKYVDVTDATQQLLRKMQMVKRQKERNQSINNEINRIRKMNTRESSSAHVYKGINQLPLSESDVSDSEEVSEDLFSPRSEYEMMLSEEERKMIDEENARRIILGTFSPRTMLERLKKERNFLYQEL